MVDIFISYAREDEPRIQPIVNALEQRGFWVFWDRHIPSGQTWRSYIGQALKKAGCVIAVWTVHSIVSDWVAEEADEGKKRSILVPVLLDRVDPPIGFRSIQASDLTDWTPVEPSPQFDQLVDDIKAALERSQNAPAEDKEARARLGKSRPREQRTSWIKNPFWQWTIGIASIAIGMVSIIVPLVFSGKDLPEQAAKITGKDLPEQAAKINGDHGTIVQLRDSPGAKVEVTRPINSEELSEKLAKSLKEEYKKTTKETIERLQQDPTNEHKQKALLALTKDNKAEAIEHLEEAVRERAEKPERSKKQEAQDWIDIGNIASLYDTQKAEEAYERASMLDPLNRKWWKGLERIKDYPDKVKEANKDNISTKDNVSIKNRTLREEETVVRGLKVVSKPNQIRISDAQKPYNSLDKICSDLYIKIGSYSHDRDEIGSFELLNDAYTSKNYERAIEMANIIMKQNCFEAVEMEKFLLERVPVNSNNYFDPPNGEEFPVGGVKWYKNYESFSELLSNLDYEQIYPLHCFVQAIIIKYLSAIKLSKYSNTHEKSVEYIRDADDCFNKALLFMHGIFQHPDANNLYISSYKFVSEFLNPQNNTGNSIQDNLPIPKGLHLVKDQ